MPRHPIAECLASNLETHVECVPRPRQWGGFQRQNRRKCRCFIPALTSDGPLAMAFLDRLVEGAIILKLKGKSYRADPAKAIPPDNTDA
jgi:hypothetical protein